MTTLADRLRGVIRPSGGPDRPNAPSHYQLPTTNYQLQEDSTVADAAEVLGGEWCESRGQRFLVVNRKYTPGYRHGRVAVADCLPPGDGIWPRLHLLAGAEAPALRGSEAAPPLLFLDLETTGLAGGAGSYAFLVGCGWFEPPSPSPSPSAGQSACFRLRQFFLSSFGAERVLLEALADLASGAACVVTYNGKTFDLPLIETRFALQRMPTPFAGLPHVDMLHHARRLWREDEMECRLTNLERSVCAHEREGDVPGFEIPSRYFHFVRSGDARGLDAVLEHNRLDIISLAMLTARASQMLEDGPSAATTAREVLGMGRLYERAGMVGEALESFARAAGGEQFGTRDSGFGGLKTRLRDSSYDDGGELVRAEALRACATLCRRLRRYGEAAAAWRQLLDLRGCPPALAREATEALAVHHEHRARDLHEARAFALRSLPLQATAARQEAIRYRLARIDRKMSSLFPLSP